VSQFCTRAPNSMPRMWIPVNAAMIRSEIRRRIDVSSNVSGTRAGKALKRYSLQPMAEAAMGAENPAISDTHPLRNPRRGWYILDRNAYSPPASGIAAPNSA